MKKLLVFFILAFSVTCGAELTKPFPAEDSSATEEGLSGTNVDVQNKSLSKMYVVYVFSGGVNVAVYRITEWRIGIEDGALYCVSDGKQIIIFGDCWVLQEE